MTLRSLIGRSSLLVASLVAISGAVAQHVTSPDPGNPLAGPANGMRRTDLGWQAFTNATIHIEPGKTVENATLVVRDGKIVAILMPEAGGKPAPLPIGPIVRDCTGLHIYPGFIDAYVEVATPLPDIEAPGAHWSAKVIPQRRATDGNGVSERDAESLRSQGFVAAALVPINPVSGRPQAINTRDDDFDESAPVRANPGGIFRGHGAVISLQKPQEGMSASRPPIYRDDVFHALAFELGGRGGGGPGGGSGSLSPQELERWPSYPGSEMGAIALIRQTLSDADWIAQARKDNYAVSPGALDSLTDRAQPLYFEVSDELEVVRAARIAREFKRPAIIKGSGLEFRRLDAIAESLGTSGDASEIPLIIPLSFPKAPDVATVGAAEAAGLREMMTWEQAPSNVRRLKDKGMRVALTSADLRSRSQFRANLEKAMRYGLAPEAAFAMLTTEPASILGVDNALGTIETGKAASFIVASGDLFALTPDEPEDNSAKDGKGPSDEKTETSDAPKVTDSEKPDGSGPAPERRRGGGSGRGDKPRATKAEIREVYIDGVRNEVALAGAAQLAGIWDVTLEKPMDGTITLTFSDAGELTITKTFTEQKDDKGNPKITTSKGKNVSADGRRVSYSFEHKPFGQEGVFSASAALAPDNGSMEGIVLTTGGDPLKWQATRRAPAADAVAARKLPGLIGCFYIDEIDGRKSGPHSGGSLICVRKDGTVTLRMNNTSLKADDVSMNDGVLKYTCDMAKITEPDRKAPSDRLVKVEGKLEGDQLVGSMVVPDGSTHQWKASRRPGDPEVLAELPDQIGYPFGPYERDDRGAFSGAAPVVVITNATVWTSGPQRILQNAFVILKGGKIEAVGSGAAPVIDGATVIDAKGKHVTPGIIDCHSHTGISKGVNEGGQAVTSEVRIQDVTDPDSISWYRQLAGGVTTVNSLHGSANAIGGQTAVNKNRWGAESADDLHFAGRDTFDDANPFAPGVKKQYPIPPGVKWALGENPRQVNGSSRNRYPQTRMGVETLIRDRLTAAREYEQAWRDWSDGKHAPGVLPPRRDLELESLAEVLNGSRLVHCHSYRQDELLALAKICKEFNFKLGTWQHILEGYKVATDVRDNARGASAFSDWWNYKVEVQDAIPQGPTLMHDVGVVVSYNSDSDEMARRLNLEAAKAVKYGNLSEEEALKFVTINPAIQLGIEKRVGSLEPGKEADVVIWSADPLSVGAHAERVYIDGREMFSLEMDAKLRKQNNDNRQRVIQKLKKEGPSRGGGGEASRESESDDEADFRERVMLDMLNRRGSLDSNMPGECGCGLVHSAP
ncbi:MAG: amidohydrolase family protein [Phycisphaeraceae bacterium]|nr:amidohydrolase family protein [Phycisphaeraceae bacterium]